jgi:3-deoxy-D-manno-octulosonic acid kinase
MSSSQSPESIELVQVPITKGAALVDRSRVAQSMDTLFDANAYSQCKQLREGRGLAFQVKGDFGLAALRHYRRGGLTGALWQDRYPFWGAEQTRCFRELRLLAQLQKLGLPVPAPLACRFIRSGVFYRADILTSWLPGAEPLSARAAQVDIATMQSVGVMLKRFHHANLWHADLNAHNVLLTEAGPALIDFDRCAFRPASDGWKEANLMRLRRSLIKLGFAARKDFDSQLWQTLLEGYQRDVS